MQQLAFYAYKPRALWIVCPGCRDQVCLDLDDDRAAYPTAARITCPHCGENLELHLEWVHQIVNVGGRVVPPGGMP